MTETSHRISRVALANHSVRRLWLFGAALAMSILCAGNCIAHDANGDASNGARGSAAPPDLSGVWQVSRYDKQIRTVEGKDPPLTAAGKARYAQNISERKTPKPRADMSRCVPPGTPRLLWAPLPLMILQTSRKVTFIHEYQHLLRHVYLDEALPALADIDPSYLGESVGRWDGDTLVIETIGLNDRTVLDRVGLPHSTAMHVTERLRLIDGGKRLENIVRIEDPETFTAPWNARIVFVRRPGMELGEYHCTLKNEEF